MSAYNYEFVKYSSRYDAKIFITTIEHSNFHWHYEPEFVFVVKGSVKVNTLPRPIVLKEGELILLNGREIHEVQKTDVDNMVLFIQISPILFQLHPDEKETCHFYLNSKDMNMEPQGGFSDFVTRIAELGISAAREKNDKNAAFRTKALLYELIADCYENLIYDVRQKADGDHEREERNKRLEELIKYVEENFEDEYVLDHMAEHFGLGEKSIYRELKLGIGLSAKELVIECRVKEARKLLKYTEKPISMIAEMVGFHSDKTFYRVFKNQLGITPNDYRIMGEQINKNDQIKGYLGVNWRESIQILEKYIKENHAGNVF